MYGSRMVKLYEHRSLSSGRPFAFASRPNDPMVKHPVTGTIMRLSTYEKRYGKLRR